MSAVQETEPDFETDAEISPVPVVREGDRSFGRYELCYQIGSGGMATVYLARARRGHGFDKPVAIKRMHPHLSHRAEFVDMFLDEARLSSRINHPNVCTVFDFGEEGGSYFIAMEYLVGAPLSAVVPAVLRAGLIETPRWQAVAAQIIADACEGLHAAHELCDESGQPLAVVHRDVTPQNLIVTFAGAVKVVDFGVARAIGRLHETRSGGGLKGKFAYMAPEQVSRRPIDRRVDVWALGVCLWEMLVGERLFRRDSEVHTITAVVEDEIRAPHVARSAVPEPLSAITMQALARDPDARLPTARALGRAVRGYLKAQSEPTSMVEVAELMEELLSKTHASKVKIVHTVLPGLTGTDIASLPTKISLDDAATTTPSGDATRPVDGDRPHPGAGPMTPSRLPRRARVALVGVAGALAFSIGGGVWLALGSDAARSAPEPVAERSYEVPAPTLPGADANATRDDAGSPETPASASTTADAGTDAGSRAARGVVNIVTENVWGEIYYRGRKLGDAPYRMSFAPGRYVFEVRLQGHAPGRRVTVDVVAGRTHRVRVR